MQQEALEVGKSRWSRDIDYIYSRCETAQDAMTKFNIEKVPNLSSPEVLPIDQN